MSEERKPWEQMEGESDLWYGRFRTYLLMGSRRSVNAVFEAENKEKQGKTRTKISRNWYDAANAWEWQARANAYDLEQQKIRRVEEEEQRKQDQEAIRTMLLNHIKAEVDKSSTSQIQAAKLLLEYYATSKEIDQIKEQMYILQETLKSLGAEL